nr:MAG TPA: hypothetical protein [Caudoviricetes sp.]
MNVCLFRTSIIISASLFLLSLLVDKKSEHFRPLYGI